MQEQILSKISYAVTYFFKEMATKLDGDIKFVKRQTKMTAQLFAQTLIQGCFSNPKISLEEMCQIIKKEKISITKQGLDQRFNEEATELMKALLKEALKQFKVESPAVIELLKLFSGVFLLDSSGISLPENLQGIYRGIGGGASEAGLKIQVLLDYINGQIKKLTLTGARMNDQSFRDHLDHIEKGALYLQDLGYFRLESFKKIQSSGAYFISRYLPTKVFDENGDLLDLIDILRKAGKILSREVYLGKEEETRIKVRLIAHLLPEKEYEKRIRKITQEARKKGRQPMQATRELARWSIYITNISANNLKDEHIHLVYTLRWQIELFFKLCKSEAGVEKINSHNPHRVQCEMYAKLICVVILMYVCFPVRWHNNQEISFKKAYKQLRQYTMNFFEALKSPYRFMSFLKEFYSNLKDFAMKDKYRKKRRLTFQQLMDVTAQEVFV